MRSTLRLLQIVGNAPKREIAPLRIDSSFKLKPLGAPIGLSHPPKPSDDHWDLRSKGSSAIERNLEKREKLHKAWNKSYFRDFRNADHNRGKFYLGNERLWKGDKALWFPNLRGRTLEGKGAKETTSVLKGKVSAVSIFSRDWAAGQAASFVGEKENPEFSQIIAESEGLAQHVRINFEEGRLFQTILWLFERNLKSLTPEDDWSRYFILRGIPGSVKEQLGMLNEKVGYCFLLDPNCRVRWSANADSTDEERAALNRGLRRLIEEQKAPKLSNSRLR
jgi:ATPase complex subunit ATP10